MAIPLLLFIGFVPLHQTNFIILSLISVGFLSGAHFGVHSIAGIYYPSAIRANGAGWATSIAKIGGVAGPILGGIFLASALPVIRIYALVAICPAILALAAISIGILTRTDNKTGINHA
jgi:AAHS family 4-hydroxybenzoate transporter-like MFS transporter